VITNKLFPVSQRLLEESKGKRFRCSDQEFNNLVDALNYSDFIFKISGIITSIEEIKG
jgi:hypothetical protein